MSNLIWGIGEILIGIGIIIVVFKNTDVEKDNSYSLSTSTKAIIGGIVFIVLGIIQLLKYFEL